MPQPATDNPLCPQCASPATHRVKRIGLIQTVVFPVLGRYPWRCGVCGNAFNSSNRGKLKRRRTREGEAHLPPMN